MEDEAPHVKGRRRYDATRRRAEAQRTREEVITAARRLFLTDGYPGTTVAAIAKAAGVSVETVYKRFGGKPGLVRAIWDAGLQGSGDSPAERRSDALHDHESDPHAIVQAWGALVAEVAPLAAPVLLLIAEAAATDPQMARLRDEIETERLARMEANARRLAAGDRLRPGVTIHEARDVLWLYSSPGLYESLVLRRGWSPERFGAFVADAIAAALLPA